MIISSYPGRPLWWKRVIHTVILCFISGNIFLNQFNDLFYEKTKEFVHITNDLLPSATSVAKSLDDYVIPALEYMETSQAGWILEDYELPNSDYFQLEVDRIVQLEKLSRPYQSIFQLASWIMAIVVNVLTYDYLSANWIFIFQW